MIYAPGDRVEFKDPEKGPIRGTIREMKAASIYRIVFDSPIFNGAIIETVHEQNLRPLSLLERLAEAADGR